MRIRTLPIVVAVIGLASACGEDEPTAPTSQVFKATLNGANERNATGPAPVTTNGTGTFTGTLDLATNIMTYTLTWSGLGTTSNNAHIHGPVPAGSTVSAGVLVDFNNAAAGRTITHGTSGSANGTINFNTITTSNANVSADSLKKLFLNGALYVNVHTTGNTGGEILGMITKQ